MDAHCHPPFCSEERLGRVPLSPLGYYMHCWLFAWFVQQTCLRFHRHSVKSLHSALVSVPLFLISFRIQSVLTDETNVSKSSCSEYSSRWTTSSSLSNVVSSKLWRGSSLGLIFVLLIGMQRLNLLAHFVKFSPVLYSILFRWWKLESDRWLFLMTLCGLRPFYPVLQWSF